MLTIAKIKENPQAVADALKIRNKDFSTEIYAAIDADNERIESQNQLDAYLAESNELAKSIGTLYKAGKQNEATEAKNRAAELKELSRELGVKVDEAKAKLEKILSEIPNIPHKLVPAGKSEADNLFIRGNNIEYKLPEGFLPHWELAKKYNIIDFELGNKITGAGFPVYVGKGAKLQRALISFFLAEAEQAGYTEYLPPLMVNKESGFGTGQLPDKEGQMYHMTVDDLYMIPTAEVPVTNIYRDVILEESDFSIKMCAYSACFRREAGSYGAHVRGLNRLHQFDKVEIVRIEHPDNSYNVLDEMVAHVESLIQKLGLKYRIIRLCGGDMGFTSAMTYDFEVYSAGQDKWLEVSSVSNFESFQANRLKLRFKPKGEKKTVLAHTLNGSALALPRILAAILENYQTVNGIQIPEALVKYTGFDFIAEK